MPDEADEKLPCGLRIMIDQFSGECANALPKIDARLVSHLGRLDQYIPKLFGRSNGGRAKRMLFERDDQWSGPEIKPVQQILKWPELDVYEYSRERKPHLIKHISSNRRNPPSEVTQVKVLVFETHIY
jgi:hypothetical protein